MTSGAFPSLGILFFIVVPTLFLLWERVPTLFALVTLLEDVGSKRLH